MNTREIISTPIKIFRNKPDEDLNPHSQYMLRSLGYYWATFLLFLLSYLWSDSLVYLIISNFSINNTRWVERLTPLQSLFKTVFLIIFYLMAKIPFFFFFNIHPFSSPLFLQNSKTLTSKK